MERPFEKDDCIKMRRLFEAVAGTMKLEEQEQEQEHLHKCELCRGVFLIFINLHTNPSVAPSKKSTAA